MGKTYTWERHFKVKGRCYIYRMTQEYVGACTKHQLASKLKEVIPDKRVETFKEPVKREEPSKASSKVPANVREWFQRWKKQGTSEYRFTSTCQVIARCPEKEAEEWLEELKKEEALKK